MVRGRIGRGRGRPVIDVRIGATNSVSLKEARTRAKTILATMRLGNDPRQADVVDLNIGDLVTRFLDTKRSAGVIRLDNIERALSRLVAGLKQQPTRLVTQSQWANAIERVHHQYSHSAAVEARKFMRAMLRWAIGVGLIPNSTALAVPVPKRTRAEVASFNTRKEARWTLRRYDWRAFWDATDAATEPVYCAFIRVLALSGLRRGECSTALWGEIDLGTGLWQIPANRTKTGRGHVVVIGPLMARVLQFLPRGGPDQLVFPSRRGVPMTSWSLHVKPVSAALVTAIQLHGLRRGYRTSLKELGISTEVAERQIAHARPDLELSYDVAELLPERRAAQSKLEAAWLESVDG